MGAYRGGFGAVGPSSEEQKKGRPLKKNVFSLPNGGRRNRHQGQDPGVQGRRCCRPLLGEDPSARDAGQERLTDLARSRWVLDRCRCQAYHT